MSRALRTLWRCASRMCRLVSAMASDCHRVGDGISVSGEALPTLMGMLGRAQYNAGCVRHVRCVCVWGVRVHEYVWQVDRLRNDLSRSDC